MNDVKRKNDPIGTIEVAGKATDANAGWMLIEHLAESCRYICLKLVRPLLASMSSHHTDLDLM